VLRARAGHLRKLGAQHRLIAQPAHYRGGALIDNRSYVSADSIREQAYRRLVAEVAAYLREVQG